jgi:hypothetical protein
MGCSRSGAVQRRVARGDNQCAQLVHERSHLLQFSRRIDTVKGRKSSSSTGGRTLHVLHLADLVGYELRSIGANWDHKCAKAVARGSREPAVGPGLQVGHSISTRSNPCSVARRPLSAPRISDTASGRPAAVHPCPTIGCTFAARSSNSIDPDVASMATLRSARMLVNSWGANQERNLRTTWRSSAAARVGVNTPLLSRSSPTLRSRSWRATRGSKSSSIEAGRPNGYQCGRCSCTARTSARGRRPPGVNLTPPSARSRTRRTLAGTLPYRLAD